MHTSTEYQNVEKEEPTIINLHDYRSTFTTLALITLFLGRPSFWEIVFLKTTKIDYGKTDFFHLNPGCRI